MLLMMMTNTPDDSDHLIMDNALDVKKGFRDINKANRYFDGIMDIMSQLRLTLLEIRDNIE